MGRPNSKFGLSYLTVASQSCDVWLVVEDCTGISSHCPTAASRTTSSLLRRLELRPRDGPALALFDAGLLVFRIRVEASSPGSLHRAKPYADEDKGRKQ